MKQLLNITEASSIAIHCIGMLAKKGEPMNINEMASITAFSKNHMAKVLQTLTKHNFLGSNRGPKGGFFLKRKPSEITFLEIFELIEGKIEHLPCGIEDDTCPFDVCIYGDAFYKLTQEFRNYYKNRTINDLIIEENEKANHKN
jgi:Rrf2 family transcriptional regulator, nitric oxide-sensitive transcriptional repressor